MAHITLQEGSLTGIFSLLYYRKEMASPLVTFTETLLRGSSPISHAEREIIASYVSYLNNCYFCFACHGATAAALLGLGIEFLDEIKEKLPNQDITPRLRSLLNIAEAVQQGGNYVDEFLITSAKKRGVSEIDIHDVVLISSAFCMFNRYVEGLNVPYPLDKKSYIGIGKKLAKDGYHMPEVTPV